MTDVRFAFGAVQHRVRNLDASLGWYEDVLGLVPFAKSDDDPNNSYAAFSIGSTPLALWQQRPGEELDITGSLGSTYVNLITDDVDALREQLTERGAEPTEVKSYGEFRFFWIFDPDGNRIEFAQVGTPSA